MSTLKDFIHHRLNAKAGHVPPPPVPPAPPADAQGRAQPRRSGAVEPNARAAAARAAGQLRGEEYYTEAQARPGPAGWQESDETVAHKLQSKEQYPQG